jgi:hypothetical protein
MAIEAAPAAVASLAWFAIHGPRIDVVIALFGGIAIRTVIALSRHQLLPHQPAAPTAQPVSLAR